MDQSHPMIVVVAKFFKNIAMYCIEMSRIYLSCNHSHQPHRGVVRVGFLLETGLYSVPKNIYELLFRLPSSLPLEVCSDDLFSENICIVSST